MTGKERVLGVLNHKEVDKVPWVPFVGVHGGALKGYSATEVLSDGDKLFDALSEAHKLYQPDGLPVIFDLQVEAEILGCELLWADKAPASVTSHPCSETLDIPCDCKIPTEESGRISMILDVMNRAKSTIGEDAALYGLICGPFTLASHLRGNNIFMDMILNEGYVNSLIEYCTRVAVRMCDLYIDAGMDVIAVVDPLVSQISPDHFTLFCMDSFKTIFDHIRLRERKSSFFVCGNATRQIDVMCQSNPDSISIDENVVMKDAKKITDQYNIVIGGNIPLTTLMLHGTQQDNMQYALHMLDEIDHKNLIIAPGCDMPYDVPAENTIGIAQAIKEPESVRAILVNYKAVSEDIEVELPNYSKLTKPLVEVFTLDSATCAACTYMMGSANSMKEKYGDTIDVVEYKYTMKENIARCVKMGVAQLPSIYINGELKWSSIIPSPQEFSEEIEKNL